MESSRTTCVPEVGLLEDRRPPGELSLVEIAERLEGVTAVIESERVCEREARRTYQDVAARVEARVATIREYAKLLLQEQRRRMVSFDGMLGGVARVGGTGGRNGHGNTTDFRELKPPPGAASDQVFAVSTPTPDARAPRLNIYEAVLRVWTLEKYRAPLTTSEIARAIKDVGYITRAAPRSMKSTLNQALAKLCRDRLVRRFRTDGTEINPEDHHSRARKYMAEASLTNTNAA